MDGRLTQRIFVLGGNTNGHYIAVILVGTVTEEVLGAVRKFGEYMAVHSFFVRDPANHCINDYNRNNIHGSTVDVPHRWIQWWSKKVHIRNAWLQVRDW